MNITDEDVFRYVVYSMQKGSSVVFDFYRLPGGPYGYALPASVVLEYNTGDRSVKGKTIYSGYPIIQFDFPKDKTQKIVQMYLRAPGFRRVSYMDSTGFKVPIKLRSTHI